MTTADTTITEAPDEKVARTPKGQMVPTCSPNDLRPLLTALASFGGPISKPILAKQVGTTITSSAYKSKLGTAGYYGFLTRNGNSFQITPRGEAFLSDDAARSQQAAQEGVMSTGFAAIIGRQTTRAANPTALAGLLVEMAGVPEARSDTVAVEMIDICTETAIIADGHFDPEAIEATMSAVGEITVTTAKPPQQAAATAAKPAAATKQPRGQSPPPAPEVEVKGATPFAPISVVIQIDASNVSPKQIGQIVRELAQTTAS